MRKLFMAIAIAAFTPLALQADDRDRGGSDNGGHNSGGGKHGNNRRLQVVGLTSDQRLICFNEFSPERAINLGVVTGLTGGDTALIGIDYRVQDGKLYGVGNLGGVYTLNLNNGSATFVNRLSVALSGTSFGVDFNPAADRLRIISDNGQNLRHNVNAGGVTINDAVLSYPPTPPATAVAALGVTGAAYTNNDLDVSTATTLYDIDSTLDQVVIQSPANSGLLAATGKLTLDVGAAIGFDIYSTLRNGVTVGVQSLASLTPVAGVASLYSISLPTGKATSRGKFKSSDQVIDIAIPLNQL